MTALRALLAGIVDYAGLFPPAALDMPAAVRNYAQYRKGNDSWMLGRFVLPVARLEEFNGALEAAGAATDGEWRLAGLLGPDVDADVARARAFNAASSGHATIDVLEGKLDTPDAIASAAEDVRHDFALYVEVPVDAEPEALIDAIRVVKVGAKIRTGGVTAAAIPATRDIVRFIRRCIAAHVPFKATAGLHHPLRAEQRMTYAADAPRGTMHGFLNIFLAAAYLEFGMSEGDAHRMLEEQDPAAFAVTNGTIAWRDRPVSAAQLRVMRDVVAVSFGSCSFREPVDELRALSILE